MNVQQVFGAIRAPRATTQPAAHAPAALRGRGLLAARLVFLAFAALAVWLDATSFWRSWQAVGAAAFVGRLSLEQLRAALAGSWLAPQTYLVLAATTFILGKLTYLVAFLIFRKRSEQVIALLVATYIVASNASDFPPTLFALLATEPIRANLHLTVTLVFAILSLWIFYVFPDGRFIPRWTIPIAACWALVNAAQFFIVRTIGGTGPVVDAAIYAVAVISVVIAQISRYRRVSGPIERQQTKWFLGGLGIWFAVFAAGNVYLGANGLLVNDVPSASGVTPWFIFSLANGFCATAPPIALAVAVLRYRLFAIDTILNRALVYGGLTTIVSGVYVLIVGYLGTLFRTGGNLAISLVATGVVAVLFQPLRGVLQRAANRLLYGERDEPYAVVARLGRRLESSLAPDAVLPTIVETVATALKLPYLAIVLPEEGGVTVAAEYGIAGSAALVAMPLVYQGETVGELRLALRPGEKALARADRRLMADLARQAGIAVRATQLTRDLQRARERLVTAREEERRRLRRDLHDGLGPALASQALAVDTAQLLLTRDPHGAAELLRTVKAQSQAAVAEIRRVAYALRPPALDDLGLVGALREAASRYAGAEPAVVIEASAALPPLPAAVEVAAYRIAQEALTNVARHANAHHCTVTLTVDTALTLVITDDGAGIPRDRRAGVGLSSMRERAEELGGTCVVEPNSGGGTRVAARLPL